MTWAGAAGCGLGPLACHWLWAGAASCGLGELLGELLGSRGLSFCWNWDYALLLFY